MQPRKLSYPHLRFTFDKLDQPSPEYREGKRTGALIDFLCLEDPDLPPAAKTVRIYHGCHRFLSKLLTPPWTDDRSYYFGYKSRPAGSAAGSSSPMGE